LFSRVLLQPREVSDIVIKATTPIKPLRAPKQSKAALAVLVGDLVAFDVLLVGRVDGELSSGASRAVDIDLGIDVEKFIGVALGPEQDVGLIRLDIVNGYWTGEVDSGGDLFDELACIFFNL
jgi:hypothetical protein